MIGTSPELTTAMEGDRDATARTARPIVIACGALVRELRTVLRHDGLDAAVDVVYLPAPLHNRPDRIVPAIEDQLADVDHDRPVLLGYADCGTGGLLDAWIARTDRDVTRLPGAHCYELFAGADRFAELHEAELGTFYLTDFLARNFDALVWDGMGLGTHPELRDVYFANYRRLVLLSQSDDPTVVELARTAATRLGLAFEHVPTGLAPFAEPVRVALRTEGR